MCFRRALVGCSAGKYQLVEDAAIPELQPDAMLCRVAAVALNPVDAKIIDYSPAPGSIGGQDFAGEVVRVGENIKRFKIGDRVCSFAYGLNSDDKMMGAFSDYAIATEDLTCKMPPGMEYEAAATLPVAIGTAGLALYQELALSWPGTEGRKPSFVLVSGGATATGVVAIQLLKASGLRPIATCSPENKDMLKSLGAIETFDYRCSTCGLEIRDFTANSLEYVLDCITTSEAMAMCYEAIGSAGGKYVSLDPGSTHVKYTRRDIYTDWVMAFTLFGKPVKLSGIYGRPAMPEHRQFAARLYTVAETMIEAGCLVPSRFKIKNGGLAGLKAGIEDLRQGQSKGGKLVYPLHVC